MNIIDCFNKKSIENTDIYFKNILKKAEKSRKKQNFCRKFLFFLLKSIIFIIQKVDNVFNIINLFLASK